MNSGDYIQSSYFQFKICRPDSYSNPTPSIVLELVNDGFINCYSDGEGGYYEQYEYCQSGYELITQKWFESPDKYAYFKYFSDGLGGGNFCTGFFQSGEIFQTGIEYKVEIPSCFLNSLCLNDGFYDIFSNGDNTFYCDNFTYCNSGYNFLEGNSIQGPNSCRFYKNYFSDGAGGVYLESGYINGYYSCGYFNNGIQSIGESISGYKNVVHQALDNNLFYEYSSCYQKPILAGSCEGAFYSNGYYCNGFLINSCTFLNPHYCERLNTNPCLSSDFYNKIYFIYCSGNAFLADGYYSNGFFCSGLGCGNYFDENACVCNLSIPCAVGFAQDVQEWYYYCKFPASSGCVLQNLNSGDVVENYTINLFLDTYGDFPIGCCIEAFDGEGGLIDCSAFLYQSGNLLTTTIDNISCCAKGLFCIDYYFNSINSFNKICIYNSGVLLDCEQIYCIELSNNFYVTGGFTGIYSNGIGSCYCLEYYYPNGTILFEDEYSQYLSDGYGGYRASEIAEREHRTVCLNWDFSKTTKSKYCFNEIDSRGSDVSIFLNDSCGSFYEINTLENTNLFINEACRCMPLYIDEIVKPFLYIRNVGICNLIVNSSKSQNYILFKNKQVCSETKYSNCNYYLQPKESILLTLNVGNSGTQYYSNASYIFGFFYEFKNVEIINPLGLYPSCCYCDYFNDKIKSLYTYKDINNLEIENGCIIQTGYSYLYKKQLSMGENFVVDKGVDLEISFQKTICTNTGSYDCCIINSNNYFSSEYEFNKFNFNIKINNILITDGIDNTLINDIVNKKCYTIIDNYNLNIIYDIDVVCEKIYNLFYKDNFTNNDLYYNSMGENWYDVSNWSFDENSSYKTSTLPHSESNIIINGKNGILIDLDCELWIQPNSICFKENACNTGVLLCFTSSLENAFSGIIYGDARFLGNSKYISSCLNLHSDTIPYYDFCILQKSNNNIDTVYSRQCLKDTCGIISINNTDTAKIYFNLQCNASIRDLINKDYSRCNLFLPTICEYNYNYNFNLNPSIIIDKQQSGDWVNDINNFEKNSGFVNSSFIVSCSSVEYFCNMPCMYCIDLHFEENRCSTSSIRDSLCSVNSDCYTIYKCNIICIFSYECINFEYTPVDSIVYADKCYKISNDCSLFIFCTNTYCEEILFPINALNYNTLLINTDFEIFDKFKCSEISINYDSFSFNNIKNKLDPTTNSLIYCIPIISNSNLSGYNYPDLTIQNQSFQLIDRLVTMRINPLNCFASDANYDLSNFLLFINSKFNKCLANDFSQNAIQYNQVDLCDVLTQIPQIHCLSDLSDVTWLYYNANLPITCNICFNGAKFAEFTQTAQMYLINGGDYVYPDHFQTCAESELVEGSTLYGSGFLLTGDNDASAWLTFFGYCFDVSSFFGFPTGVSGPIGYEYLMNCRILATNYIDFIFAVSGFFDYHTQACSGLFNMNTGFANFSLSWLDNEPFSYISEAYVDKIVVSNNFNFNQNILDNTSPDYNFLMFDLNKEYSKIFNKDGSYKFTGNSGAGSPSMEIIKTNWNLICQSTIISDFTDATLLNYKNCTGIGYNYIIPVVSCMLFLDCSYILSGNEEKIWNNVEINLYPSQNKLNTGVSYNCFSSLRFFDNNFLISISQDDVKNNNSKSLFYEKFYNFSGVQPVYIESNYQLLNIKYPILNTDLSSYSNEINNNLSGTYYYIYDINNFNKCDLRFVSPNSTLINYMCWIDEDIDFKCINRYTDNIDVGKIINDTAQISLNIENLIYANSYFYNCILDPKIFINIRANL